LLHQVGDLFELNVKLRRQKVKPWVLTTTQRRLRERDAASAEVRAVAVKGIWFLNDRRMSVAQGHYAVPAALSGSDIRTLNFARHASLGPAGYVCRRVLYLLY